MVEKIKWVFSVIFLIASAAHFIIAMMWTVYDSFAIFKPFIVIGACLMGLYVCAIAKDGIFGSKSPAQKD